MTPFPQCSPPPGIFLLLFNLQACARSFPPSPPSTSGCLGHKGFPGPPALLLVNYSRKLFPPLSPSQSSNRLVSMRMGVQSQASLSGLRMWHCCEPCHRCGLDPSWLWLWCRPAAPIGPLAWELTYAMDAALKKKKKKI